MATNRYPYLEGRSRKLTLAAVMAIFSPVLRVELPDRLAAVPDPAIFAINHNASLESVAVPSALIHHRAGRPIHFMIDWMFLHLPLVGWIMRQAAQGPDLPPDRRGAAGEVRAAPGDRPAAAVAEPSDRDRISGRAWDRDRRRGRPRGSGGGSIGGSGS